MANKVPASKGYFNKEMLAILNKDEKKSNNKSTTKKTTKKPADKKKK